jgi:hypothetical protein
VGLEVRISYEVFLPGQSDTCLPYGMHPSVYYNGAHTHPWDPARDSDQPWPIQVGFYGTHDPEFYSRDYAFPGLNRSQLVKAFLACYGDECIPAPTVRRVAFALLIDQRCGVLQPKHFLPQHAYLQTMRHTAFSLCLPGFACPFPTA